MRDALGMYSMVRTEERWIMQSNYFLKGVAQLWCAFVSQQRRECAFDGTTWCLTIGILAKKRRNINDVCEL